MVELKDEQGGLKKIAYLQLHEQCLLLESLDLQSWDIVEAAGAYKKLLEKMYKKGCPKGYRLKIHLILTDLGSDCVNVDNDEIMKGRWVKLGYTVYLKKKE